MDHIGMVNSSYRPALAGRFFALKSILLFIQNLLPPKISYLYFTILLFQYEGNGKVWDLCLTGFGNDAITPQGRAKVPARREKPLFPEINIRVNYFATRWRMEILSRDLSP